MNPKKKTVAVVKRARSKKEPGTAVVPAARAFEAGRPGRRLAAIPTTGAAINTQIRQYGANVLARSRHLAENNPYAAAAKTAFVSALVGCGIKPSSLVDNATLKKTVQELWLRWTDEADADGLTDFYGLQSLVGSEMFEAGECFVRLRARLKSDGYSVPLQIQLLPSEMCPLDYNQSLGSGRRIECGIQFNAIGQREGYWFYRSHPRENTTWDATRQTQRVFVPAEQVIHLFKPVRVGQVRGLPHTMPGVVTLAMSDLYDDAELERKRVAALFSVFITRPRGESDEDHPLANVTKTVVDSLAGEIGLEPGAVLDLLEGQEIQTAAPADVGNSYDSFQYRTLLKAAAGFGVPYSDMTGDLRQTSYGSQRAGMVSFRRKIEAIQHHVLVYQFCRPIWQRWFADAVRTGALKGITATNFTAAPADFWKAKWIPPKWDWIDPLKDRQAEKLAVDSGFKPRGDVIEAEGYDPEEVDQRIAQDQQRATDLGLKFIQLSSDVILAPNNDVDEEPTEQPDEPPTGGPDR